MNRRVAGAVALGGVPETARRRRPCSGQRTPYTAPMPGAIRCWPSRYSGSARSLEASRQRVGERVGVVDDALRGRRRGPRRRVGGRRRRRRPGGDLASWRRGRRSVGAPAGHGFGRRIGSGRGRSPRPRVARAAASGGVGKVASVAAAAASDPGTAVAPGRIDTVHRFGHTRPAFSDAHAVASTEVSLLGLVGGDIGCGGRRQLGARLGVHEPASVSTTRRRVRVIHPSARTGRPIGTGSAEVDVHPGRDAPVVLGHERPGHDLVEDRRRRSRRVRCPASPRTGDRASSSVHDRASRDEGRAGGRAR